MRVASLLLLAACAPVGDRLQFEVPVRATHVGGPAFESADGGVVALTEATVTFSDLRLEEPPAEEGAGTALLRRLVVGNEAWAHPGHDFPGDVAGELLGAFTVDLLAGETELGTALCYEGKYATARVHVGGEFATFAGTYTPAEGGEPVPFRFVVAADQEILDLPFAHTMDAEAPPGAVVVAVDLAEVFAFTDWSLPEDGLANSVEFGAVASASWSVAVSEE